MSVPVPETPDWLQAELSKTRLARYNSKRKRVNQIALASLSLAAMFCSACSGWRGFLWETIRLGLGG
jgi:hypothetical protein